MSRPARVGRRRQERVATPWRSDSESDPAVPERPRRVEERAVGERGAREVGAGEGSESVETPVSTPTPELHGPPRRYSRFDLRPIALPGLFLLAVFYTLFLARAFVLPIVLALLVSLLLRPPMHALKRLKLPDMGAAGVVVLLLVGVLSLAGWGLSEPVTRWVDRAPTVAHRLELKFGELRGRVERMSQATEKVEDLARMDNGDGRSRQATVEVSDRPRLSQRLLGHAGTAAVNLILVLVLTFFFLGTGDMLLRKTVRILPRLHDKKRAVHIARCLQRDISAYLATITLINLMLGLGVAGAMYLLDMPNPALWGVMAALLNYVPYLGAMVGIAITGIVGTLTFEGIGQSLLPPLAYLALTGLEGYFLTPLLVGRRLTLNPLAILLGLIFWGWLWGVVGAILAVPILASFKIFCDHIGRLKPLGELLGG